MVTPVQGMQDGRFYYEAYTEVLDDGRRAACVNMPFCDEHYTGDIVTEATRNTYVERAMRVAMAMFIDDFVSPPPYDNRMIIVLQQPAGLIVGVGDTDPRMASPFQ